MIGVALSTRLSAVSPTASVAAFLLLPNGLTSRSPASTLCRSASDSAGYTSMPCLISSPRIRNTLSAPAVATAAKGTNRPAITFALGERLLRRGTSALRPSATPQDALTARRYDCTMVEVESGIDLFALEKLIPTLTDWFVTCHPSVPAVCTQSVLSLYLSIEPLVRTPRPGVSIPAVTTKLVKTKLDMRKGRKTGLPVSCTLVSVLALIVPSLHRL